MVVGLDFVFVRLPRLTVGGRGTPRTLDRLIVNVIIQAIASGTMGLDSTPFAVTDQSALEFLNFVGCFHP